MEGLHDRGPTVFIVTLVLMILATVFTILRLISKWGVTRNATADDYAALIAWAFAVGLSVAIIVGTTVGLGAPDSQIPPSWVLPLERSIYAFTVLYHPALMAIKAAILILYYRVATAHPFFRRASLITLAVVSVAGIVLTFLCIFQCRPVSAAFNDVAGKCIDLVSLYLSSAPISVLTDLAILILPLPFLTSLRMVVREKVILVATFVMGGFVTIVDVVRIAYLQAVLKEERRVNQFGSFTAINRSPNSSYSLSFSLMWSAVEISVGIICCCILVLKPLVLRVTPKYFGRKTPQQTTTPQWLLKSDSQNRPLDAAQPESPLSPPLSTELSPCYLQNTTSPSTRSFPGVDGYQSSASTPQSTDLSLHQLQGSLRVVKPRQWDKTAAAEHFQARRRTGSMVSVIYERNRWLGEPRPPLPSLYIVEAKLKTH